MPEVLDWQRIADPQAVIQYAVQSLRQGRTVAFATANGCAVTASGLMAEAVGRLPADAELTLALRGAGETRDWAPGLSSLGLRLARRLWPGPVTLRVGGDIERGLASRLPDEVRSRLCVQGRLHLAAPCQEVLREVLHHLPGPLLMTATAESNADVIVADGGTVDRRDAGPTSAGRTGETPVPPVAATVLAVNGNAWEIVRAGAMSAEEIRQRTACWIVFVCTGNTCRSPLAEALCKKQLADRLSCTVEELPSRGYRVMSAGVSAMAGGAAAAEAEQVARSYGADLSAHRSQPLTAELAERADYLLGMTQSHLRAVTDYFGHLANLSRLLDPAGDIADPLGCAQPVYDACAQQIWRHLQSLVAEITGNV